MTPHLQNLDGSPLSWPVLLERAAAYWHGHDRRGREIVETRYVVEQTILRQPQSSACDSKNHGRCSGLFGKRWPFERATAAATVKGGLHEG